MENPNTRPKWEDIAERRASLKYWWHRYKSLGLDTDSEIIQIRIIDPSGEPRWRKNCPRKAVAAVVSAVA